MSTEIQIPDEVRRMMAEIGPKWASNTAVHVRMMIDAYTPLLARCPKEGVEVTRNIVYGAHPRQVLDVYRPSGAKNAPVVLFVHGGAFVDGEKDRSPEIYGNVCIWFARHGIVGINVEFRLAPEFKYPSGTADVCSAAKWAAQNAASIGGDPARLFVFGHSAGAAHTAAYAYGAEGSEGGPKVAGSIVVSGRVRADNLASNPNAKKVEAYYGTDAALFDARSALTGANSAAPTFIAIAEYENPMLDVYCLELAHKLAQQKGKAPRFLQLPGHNHTSIIAHLNTADNELGNALVAFVRDTR